VGYEPRGGFGITILGQSLRQVDLTRNFSFVALFEEAEATEREVHEDQVRRGMVAIKFNPVAVIGKRID
jgi:hypothetical protein